MPPTKHPDHLGNWVKRFTRLSTHGDAGQWLAARLTWRPELRAFVAAHAPSRVAELDALLDRPIPPAFPSPGDVPIREADAHRRRHLARRDEAARSVTRDIHALLAELLNARATGKDTSPPSASKKGKK